MYLEISNPMDYHVALYIRLSKEDETEGPSQSVTNQKSLLNEFVQQHRLSVYDTYVDDGWSGTSFDRPDFQRMIEDIEAKKVNMVITKDLSRLGRDYIMTGHYMERYFPEKSGKVSSLAASPCMAIRCIRRRKTKLSSTRKWLLWCAESSPWHWMV